MQNVMMQRYDFAGVLQEPALLDERPQRRAAGGMVSDNKIHWEVTMIRLGALKHAGFDLFFDPKKLRRLGNILFVGSTHRASAFLRFLDTLKEGDLDIHLHYHSKKKQSEFDWLLENRNLVRVTAGKEELQNSLPAVPSRYHNLPDENEENSEVSHLYTPYFCIFDDLSGMREDKSLNLVRLGVLREYWNFASFGVASPIASNLDEIIEYTKANTWLFAPFDDDNYLCYQANFGFVLPSMLDGGDLLIRLNGQWDILQVDTRWLPS